MVKRIAGLSVGMVMLLSLLCACGGGETAVKSFPFALEKPFITNLSDSQKILRTEIVLEVTDEALVTSLVEESYKIEDTVISILRELTDKEVAQPGIKDELKTKILDALKAEFGEIGEQISKVYFTTFVVAKS